MLGGKCCFCLVDGVVFGDFFRVFWFLCEYVVCLVSSLWLLRLYGGQFGISEGLVCQIKEFGFCFVGRGFICCFVGGVLLELVGSLDIRVFFFVFVAFYVRDVGDYLEDRGCSVLLNIVKRVFVLIEGRFLVVRVKGEGFCFFSRIGLIGWRGFFLLV